MTSSQEPPLTRREARERERLREQQATPATPEPATPATPQVPQAPVAAPYPQAAPTPVPAGPGYGAVPAQAPAPAPAAPPPAPRPAPAPQQSPNPFGAPTTYPGTPPVDRPRSSAPAAPSPAAPATPAAPQASAPERTLTRRELRAMLDAHSGDGFDELGLDDEPMPEPRSAASVNAPEAYGAPVAQPQQRTPSLPAPIRTPAPHSTVDTGLDDLVATPKPIGHWTSQLNLPEEPAEPFDQLLSRGGGVRGIPTTTNALILPTLPDQGSIGGTPLAKSGEIMVTGSIDLPRSYGSTGVHPSQIDSTDIDRLFEQVEDSTGTGVAPVAATSAISTQGGTRTMLAPPTKEGMNVPLVLAVTAGILALGVVGTLVIGALTGLFS
jgi:hypothetical protein